MGEGCFHSAKRSECQVKSHRAQSRNTDSSTHSIDEEAEEPRGTSSCLSVAKCLKQGLGTQWGSTDVTYSCCSYTAQSPVLCLELSRGVPSPGFPGPDLAQPRLLLQQGVHLEKSTWASAREVGGQMVSSHCPKHSLPMGSQSRLQGRLGI